jgi:predicted enzyme related to lactoylglutathione lyase
VKLAFLGLLAGLLACHRPQEAKLDVPPSHSDAVAADPGPNTGQRTMPQDAGRDTSTVLSSIEKAMGRLVTAMVKKDPGGVLACFSRKKPTWLISTGVDGRTRKMKFSYGVIQKGMKTDGDFWYYFFDDESELVRGVQMDQHWTLVKDNTFVAPVYAKDPDSAPASVRWRKEGESYVIDAIFDSGA